MFQLPSHIQVIEVAPRDGLQSFPRGVPTATKVAIVDRLSEVGFEVIEVSGFAHPRAVPNLADAAEVFAGIRRRPGTVYRALVPNARGAERAAAASADELLGLLVASPSYLAKNQNMSPDKAIAEAVEAFRIAERHSASFVAAIAMSFWCPYEGVIPQEGVVRLLQRLRDAGIRRFYLAGSVGMEDPRHVRELFGKCYDALPDIELGYHVHNLGGMATANILAALDAGARWIEGAICGIGGGIAMPTSVGAVGNFPTEDLVRYLSLLGVETHLDADRVLDAARDIAAMLEVTPRSHAANGLTRERVMRAPQMAD